MHLSDLSDFGKGYLKTLYIKLMDGKVHPITASPLGSPRSSHFHPHVWLSMLCKNAFLQDVQLITIRGLSRVLNIFPKVLGENIGVFRKRDRPLCFLDMYFSHWSLLCKVFVSSYSLIIKTDLHCSVDVLLGSPLFSISDWCSHGVIFFRSLLSHDFLYFWFTWLY